MKRQPLSSFYTAPELQLKFSVCVKYVLSYWKDETSTICSIHKHHKINAQQNTHSKKKANSKAKLRVYHLLASVPTVVFLEHQRKVSSWIPVIRAVNDKVNKCV